jgi:uncharacterized damage-inducible protein DinB
MDLRQDLIERFDYDLWANRQWWAAVGKLKDLARAQASLEHILTAQRVWLSRLGVEVSQASENLGIDDVAVFVNRAWKMVVSDSALDQPITYRNLAGFEFTNTVAQIANHVVNHGTYHRGQLRGQAQAEGLESFPETDLIVFYRERMGLPN